MELVILTILSRQQTPAAIFSMPLRSQWVSVILGIWTHLLRLEQYFTHGTVSSASVFFILRHGLTKLPKIALYSLHNISGSWNLIFLPQPSRELRWITHLHYHSLFMATLSLCISWECTNKYSVDTEYLARHIAMVQIYFHFWSYFVVFYLWHLLFFQDMYKYLFPQTLFSLQTQRTYRERAKYSLHDRFFFLKKCLT